MSTMENIMQSGNFYTEQNALDALKIWHVLVRAAMNGETMTYGRLSELTEIPYFPFSYQNLSLGLIQNYCEDNEFPPLTVLVVRKDTGIPSDGYRVRKTLDDDKKMVCKKHDWKTPDIEEFRQVKKR